MFSKASTSSSETAWSIGIECFTFMVHSTHYLFNPWNVECCRCVAYSSHEGNSTLDIIVKCFFIIMTHAHMCNPYLAKHYISMYVCMSEKLHIDSKCRLSEADKNNHLTVHPILRIETHIQIIESARSVVQLNTWPCVVIVWMLMLSQSAFEFIIIFCSVERGVYFILIRSSTGEENSLALRPGGYHTCSELFSTLDWDNTQAHSTARVVFIFWGMMAEFRTSLRNCNYSTSMPKVSLAVAYECYSLAHRLMPPNDSSVFIVLTRRRRRQSAVGINVCQLCAHFAWEQ